MSEQSAIQVFTGMLDAAQYGVGLQRGYDPNRKKPTTELEVVVRQQLKEANRREHPRTDNVSLFDVLLQHTNELLPENDTLLWFRTELNSRKILFFALQENREKSAYIFHFHPQEENQDNSVFFEHFWKKSKNLKIS